MEKIGNVERFLNESGGGNFLKLGGKVEFAVATHDQNGEIGVCFADFMQELVSVHAWHGQIQKNHLDLIFVSLVDFERFDAVLGGINLVSLPGEDFTGQCADAGFIIYHEDMAAGRGFFIVRLQGPSFGLGCGWGRPEIDREGRPGPGLALDVERGRVPPDDTEYRGEAEATAGEFGGKKGFKNFGQIFRADTTAGIGDAERDTGSGWEVFRCKATVPNGKWQIAIRSGQGDGTGLVAHGFGRVDDKIQNELPNLGLIRSD